MDKLKALFTRLSDSIKGFFGDKVTPFARKTTAAAAEMWNGKIRPGAGRFFSKPVNLIICGGVVAAIVLAVVLSLLYVNVWSWVDNVTVTMPEDVYAASLVTSSDLPAVSQSDVSGSDVSGSDAVSGADVVSGGDAAVEAPAEQPVSSSDMSVSGSDVSGSDVVEEEQPEPVSVVLRMKKGSTVADALAQLNVTLDESLSIDTPLETELEKDMVITIYRMKLVSVIVDSRRVNHYTEALTVGDALSECGITLGEHDRVSCELQTPVTNNMTVEISRVAIVDEVRAEAIPFSTEKRENADVLAGQSSVITAGVEGSKDVTYRCTYVDGVLESEEIVGETVTLEPVTEVIEVGTKRTTTTRKTTAGRYIVSREKVYDCDGSGHGYYIITYSDGTVVYKDF